MAKKKDEITIRSSAAEYLTYVASVGDQQDSIEMRYEDENIWLTQKMMATLYDVDAVSYTHLIELAFWEGYQYKEIAVIFGCSPAAVTLLLQRAFHRLRSFLAE